MERETVVLETKFPTRIKLNYDQVKKIVSDLYGMNALKIKELNGYDDKNYFFTNGEVGNNGYVLKVINSIDSEKQDIFKAQTLLLLHLGKHDIKCPKPILTKFGTLFEKYELDSGHHIIRLLNYIDGNLLVTVPYSPALFYQIGQKTAHMNNAMKSFKHSAYDTYQSLWMLEQVPQLKHFLNAVEDERKRRMVELIINEFSERVLPTSSTLEKGLIHGDVNEQNIIVEKQDEDYKIKAIIDFGDSHIGCYLYEIAITMTYMIILAKSIKAGGCVLSGYSSVRRINNLERSLLKVCIAARMCQSLVMGAYTYQQDPKNTYVLTTSEFGWPLLEELWNHSDKNLLQIWRSAGDQFESDRDTKQTEMR